MSIISILIWIIGGIAIGLGCLTTAVLWLCVLAGSDHSVEEEE